MKIYFLVEGQESEVALYPFWLSKLIPTLTQADNLKNLDDNGFYLVSGYGYPAMCDNNNITNSIVEINAYGSFDYFVICIDADNKSVQQKKNEINNHILNNNLSLSRNCKLIIIVQNPCIETWLLGAKSFYPTIVRNKNFLVHQAHYDVSLSDPELMSQNPLFKLPISRYHFVYLNEMLKPLVRYTKSNPKGVMTTEFFNDMIDRLNDQSLHLISFKEFIQFCDHINTELPV